MLDGRIKVSKMTDDLYLITEGPLSRRYRTIEEILNELYNCEGTDVSAVLEKLEAIEKRLKRIECFCNSLADAVAPLEAFR